MEEKYQFINLSYMELMADNDPTTKKTMIKMLVEGLPEEIEQMDEFILVKNWAGLRKASHKMKSTLSFVGNETMTFANKQIEQICIWQDRLDQLTNLVGILKEINNLVIKELSLELQKIQA